MMSLVTLLAVPTLPTVNSFIEAVSEVPGIEILEA
jgi:hypothetical protein